jgi:hypothetical protein
MANPTVTLAPARSYLTVQEFKDAPTGIDTANLIPGGIAGAEDKELANVIARASSWIDDICNQILAPTTNTERHRVRPGRRGQLFVKTDSFPIIRITALKYTTDPSSGWTSVDLSSAVVLAGDRSFEAFLNLSRTDDCWVEVTYENGMANTTLAATASAGAASILVGSAVGIYAGQELTIYDGANTETIVVATSYVAGGTTVAIAGTLANAHSTVGVAVSALPPRVKEAAILATGLLIKDRGAEAIVLDDAAGTRISGPGPELSRRGDYTQLVGMLEDFKVRVLAP